MKVKMAILAIFTFMVFTYLRIWEPASLRARITRQYFYFLYIKRVITKLLLILRYALTLVPLLLYIYVKCRPAKRQNAPFCCNYTGKPRRYYIH